MIVVFIIAGRRSPYISLEEIYCDLSIRENTAQPCRWFGMGEYWLERGMKGALRDAGRFGYLCLVVITWAFIDVNVHWAVHLRFKLFVHFILFTLYFNFKNLMWVLEWCYPKKAQLTVLTSSSVHTGRPLCRVQQLLQQTSSCLWLWYCLCTKGGLGYHSLGEGRTH